MYCLGRHSAGLNMRANPDKVSETTARRSTPPAPSTGRRAPGTDGDADADGDADGDGGSRPVTS